jgi:FtsH-binding integral membrane protein
MNKILQRIAAILAAIIGAMAIFAGGQVLLGKTPDYYVIDWLPVYNFALGVLSVFLVAWLIWKQSRYAIPAAIGVLGVHLLVMLTLLFGYGDVVAKDSIVAMTIRITTWAIILGLMLIQFRKDKVETQKLPLLRP